MAKCRYANVKMDGPVWNRVIDEFRMAMALGATDEGHAAAIAAKNGFQLSTDQWNAPMGHDAFASALGVLVMSKTVTMTETEKLNQLVNTMTSMLQDEGVRQALQTKPDLYNDAHEALGIDPNPKQMCDSCNGKGWWNEYVEDENGEDVAEMALCELCEGTGSV